VRRALQSLNREKVILQPMKFSLLFLVLSVGVAYSDVIDVSALVDCEAGNDGDTLTATMLGTATKGTIGSGGSWAVTGSNMKVETSAEQNTLADFRIGSTVYSDADDTRGFICLDKASSNYAGYSFSPSISASFSIGFWWKPGYTNGQSVTIDHIIAGTANGNWAALQSLNGSCWMHVGNPTNNGSSISITLNQWYWVTMKFISSAACSLKVYNTSGTLVGTSTANQTASAGNWTYFRFGRTDNHGGSTGGTLEFDDIVFGFSSATFPLGPGSAGSRSTGPYWVSTTGTATWANARGTTALSGTACASISTMNANATAGDTVYIRAGTTAAGTGQINLVNDGSSGAPIIIEAYQSEVFTINNRTSAQGPAIDLTNRDYITFRKIRTNDCQESVEISGCTNIRFENCRFVNHKNTQTGWPVAVTINNNSQFNVFKDTEIGTCGYASGGGTDDAGGCVNIGTRFSETDASRFNWFSNCTLYRGGHDVVSDYAAFNFFDGCFFYNDEWYRSQPFGDRAFISEDDSGASASTHGNTTFRDCLFQRSGDPPDGDGVAIMSLRTKRNRVIRCVFVDGSNAGVNVTGVDATDNRIAHCVFVRNGVNTPQTDSGQKGGVNFFDSGGDPSGNAVKNCIFRDNFDNITYEGVSNTQTLANNWLHATGDPLFVDWSTGDLDPDNRTAHDFHLQDTSRAIDNGGWLTTAKSTSSGTSLVVADSLWFTDGDGVAPGDRIQIQGSSTVLTVTSVNYSTNTLTISPSTSWTSGNGVGFVYSDSAPDQGAFEADSVPLMNGLAFEAENGHVEPPFAVASGKVSQSTQTNGPTQGGRVRWRVTIPATGAYRVSLNVAAPNAGADSMFIDFDEEPVSPTAINDVIPLTSGVEARYVNWRGTGTTSSPEFVPKTWTLTAGVHTLYLRGREANALIDSVTIESFSSGNARIQTLNVTNLNISGP
jgi:hypothetical protein